MLTLHLNLQLVNTVTNAEAFGGAKKKSIAAKATKTSVVTVDIVIRDTEGSDKKADEVNTSVLSRAGYVKSGHESLEYQENE